MAATEAIPFIVFIVYDIADAVRDEGEFRRDLEATDGVKVLLIKH